MLHMMSCCHVLRACVVQVCVLSCEDITLPVFVSGQGLNDLLGQFMIPAWAIEIVKSEEAAVLDVKYEIIEFQLPESLAADEFSTISLRLPVLRAKACEVSAQAAKAKAQGTEDAKDPKAKATLDVILNRLALPDELGPKVRGFAFRFWAWFQNLGRMRG